MPQTTPKDFITGYIDDILLLLNNLPIDGLIGPNLERLANPQGDDSFENFKQNPSQSITAQQVRTHITKILYFLKLHLDTSLNTDQNPVIQTIEVMESDLEGYLDDINDCEKKEITDIDDYPSLIKRLKWFAERFSRRIYGLSTPAGIEDDSIIVAHRDKWTSELSLLERLSINEITDEHKHQTLQICLEQARERVRLVQDSLTVLRNELIPQLREYNFVRQSRRYILGEVVCKHILLNEKIKQHPQKAFFLKVLLEQGFISTPNALITYLDCFPLEDEKDIEHFLSQVFTKNYLHKVGRVHENRYDPSDENTTNNHAMLSGIIEKIASATNRDYEELINTFVEHNRQYLLLLTLQYDYLLSQTPDESIQKKAQAVYSALKKLYYRVDSCCSNYELGEQQELAESYLYRTNQLLRSKPNSPERERLLKEYKQFALEAEGKPSRYWQVAGAAMLGLAACLLALQIGLIASGVVGLVGLSIFAAASVRTKESKAMLDFHNTLTI